MHHTGRFVPHPLNDSFSITLENTTKYQLRASTDQLTVRGTDASPAVTPAIGCEELKAIAMASQTKSYKRSLFGPALFS